MQGVEIRPLVTVEELDAVVELQKRTEGQEESAIHRRLLLSFVNNGGFVVGAVKDNQVIGYLIGYLGLENPQADRPAMANLKMVSQRMGVLPEYRDHGVGYALKLAQRRYAVEHGIRLITWTFDPLKSRNAHFNIRKLGAIAREYYRDFYHTQTGDKASAQSSDRLLVEWWVTNNRVEQRVNARRAGLTIEQYMNGNATLINPTRLSPSGMVLPADDYIQARSNIALIEVPDRWEEINESIPSLADAWRAHTREMLEGVLNEGAALTDFVHGQWEGRERSFYVASFVEFVDFQVARFSSN